MAARNHVRASILGQTVVGVERDREYVTPYEDEGPGERVLVEVGNAAYWVHEDDLEYCVDEAYSG